MKTSQNVKNKSSLKKPKSKRKPVYPAHVLTMIYNPLAAQLETEDAAFTEVLPFTVPVKLGMDRTFIQLINRIQSRRLALYYPDNFYVHFTLEVLRMKRPVRQPEIVTLPRLERLLRRDNTKLLAWVWFYAVQWVFVTDTMFARCTSEFDEPDGLRIKGARGQDIPVSTGFTFDAQVEGLSLFETRGIQLLFNPLHISKHWLIADVLDLAVHECTHCIVRRHNEQFVLIESQLRKELRRLVDEQRLLDAAREMLTIFD